MVRRPWRTIISVQSTNICLKPECSCEGGEAYVWPPILKLRARQWDDPRIPHKRWDSHLTWAKLMGEFGLRCQSLEQNAVSLDSYSWSRRPHGPGFGDKGPVTQGGFQSAASLLKPSNTDIWRGQKAKAYRPSKQQRVGTATQLQNKDKVCERLAELSELWVAMVSSSGRPQSGLTAFF